MKSILPLLVVVFFLTACQKEDLRAPDFKVTYSAASSNKNKVVGTLANISSTPAHSVSMKIDRYTDFNLVQDPIFIRIERKLFQGDTAQFILDSSADIKRIETTIISVN